MYRRADQFPQSISLTTKRRSARGSMIGVYNDQLKVGTRKDRDLDTLRRKELWDQTERCARTRRIGLYNDQLKVGTS